MKPPSPTKAVIPLLDEAKPLSSRSSRVRDWAVRKFTKHPKRSIAAVLALLVIGYFSVTNVTKQTSDNATKTPQGTVTKITRNEKPTFGTVLPAGKKIEDYGGWARVSPPESAPVFAYADKIDGIQVNVSQQELPDDLKKDTEENLASLAENFHADQKLTVDNTTAYIGTSSKGPQSVIFVRSNLLILIRSTDKVSNDQWTAYISSLQ